MESKVRGPGHSGTRPSPARGAADGAQHLTLRLGAEEYAVDILRVQEIRSYEPPTRMVNAPLFVLGVIDLRGVMVPIVDLRLKLQLAHVEYTGFTVVVIVQVRDGLIGVVVDAVCDVVSLSPGAIRPAPQFASASAARFMAGLATIGERMLIVFDLDALLSNAEMGLVADALRP